MKSPKVNTPHLNHSQTGRSPSRYTTSPKGTKLHRKTEVCSLHIVELSTAVVKVDIKVINAT